MNGDPIIAYVKFVDGARRAASLEASGRQYVLDDEGERSTAFGIRHRKNAGGLPSLPIKSFLRQWLRKDNKFMRWQSFSPKRLPGSASERSTD
jgi:hypothetical protein